MTEPAVVLVGPMAVGKSTVGPLLARRLGRTFTDVDEMIVSEQGREISEIFATDGEATFRAIEAETTLRALAGGGVVALGGGAVTIPAVREALGDHRVVWLTATVDDAVLRVGRGDDRPLLADDVAGNWSRLVAEREPWYAQVADHRVVTSGRRPHQVARIICELLEAE